MQLCRVKKEQTLDVWICYYKSCYNSRRPSWSYRRHLRNSLYLIFNTSTYSKSFSICSVLLFNYLLEVACSNPFCFHECAPDYSYLPNDKAKTSSPNYNDITITIQLLKLHYRKYILSAIY